MERSSKAIHGSSKGEIGVRESRSDQMACVCTDIPSLMVCMNGQVESQQLWGEEGERS